MKSIIETTYTKASTTDSKILECEHKLNKILKSHNCKLSVEIITYNSSKINQEIVVISKDKDKERLCNIEINKLLKFYSCKFAITSIYDSNNIITQEIIIVKITE